MDEELVFRISFIILIIGLIAFFLFYEEEFPERNIRELIDSNKSGKVFGVIDHIIFQNENTLFIFSKDKKIKVFYPKKTDLKKGDFVYVYGKASIYKGEEEIFASKVVKE